jgi:asparagine synthase (glutamine-hydrolysing)
MAATMVNRGPDGHGTWSDENAGLAATRLMIIDLHERSNQPMHLGSLHLAFNGEIYNYKELRKELQGLGHAFQTEGDAEVLLYAWAEWGHGALDRFNGMFAFAVYDDESRELTLAADPFGEKPLYYAQRNGKLVFASEIKALLDDPDIGPSTAGSAVANFVVRGVMPPTGESFFEGIRRLSGAHVLTFADGGIRLRRYWKPERVDVPTDYREAVSTLRELLLDSIRLRLRSDVPVGTSLSGGIDSSTIVMLSAELAGDHTRHAFTAHFPGFELDEWRYARDVASCAGVVEHHGVEPTAGEAIDDLPRLVRDHEEPVGSLSIYAQWRVMRCAKAAGVTVLLDGQGADELFGGYLPTIGWALRSSGALPLARELLARPGHAKLVANSLAVDHLPTPLRRSYRRRTSTPYAARGLVELATGSALPPRAPAPADETVLRRQLATQSFVTTLPSLLRYADRSSMAWSREVRLPYLDRRIANLAFSLPTSFLYADGVTKRILRDVGQGLVPDAILARGDKVGFAPPQERWLNEPGFRELIGDVVLDPSSRVRQLYDCDAVETDLRAGAWRDAGGIWRVLNTELWLRELVEQPAPRPATPRQPAVG